MTGRRLLTEELQLQSEELDFSLALPHFANTTFLQVSNSGIAWVSCVPGRVHPACIIGICMMFRPGFRLWALQLSNLMSDSGCRCELTERCRQESGAFVGISNETLVELLHKQWWLSVHTSTVCISHCPLTARCTANTEMFPTCSIWQHECPSHRRDSCAFVAYMIALH